jgi:hypothetical protein
MHLPASESQLAHTQGRVSVHNPDRQDAIRMRACQDSSMPCTIARVDGMVRGRPCLTDRASTVSCSENHLDGGSTQGLATGP